MTEISLVLPFALPPPELAADLTGALKTPALAMLLSRTSSHLATGADSAARTLPHEWWLAHALGLAVEDRPAVAGSVMRGFGLDGSAKADSDQSGGAGRPSATSANAASAESANSEAANENDWFIVNPAHFEITRSHLLLHDLRRLGLSDAHSRSLFDAAKPYFDEAGHTLLYGDADNWFMRARDWIALDTATPDAAAGMNLTDWLPVGEQSRQYRKLQNEVQMLWHEHPVNREREARGLATVNAFWPWGGAPATANEQAVPLFASSTPAWLAPIAEALPFSALLERKPHKTIYYCDQLSEAAIATEWAAWLGAMQELEDTVFAPALAALEDGTLATLRLVLSRRTALAEFTTTRMAQRKFWRRPVLDRLLP